jgi:uncharacterized protein
MTDIYENYKYKVLEFYPYKIFKENNSYYLYTINSSGLFQIDERTLLLIKNQGKKIEQVYPEVKHLFSLEKFLELIEEMRNAGFLKVNSDDIFYKEEDSDSNEKISSLTLMIVQECNMKCKYCYGEGGEYSNKGRMSREVAIKAIDFLIENSDKKELLIAFFGGEPLLNLPLIKEVIDYCIKQETIHNKKFLYTTTTNGTLITKEIEKYLLSNNIAVQISIDGKQESHDKNRYFANKEGSYNQIIQRTENIRKNNILAARATVTSENLNYIEIFNHLSNLEFKPVSISVAQNLLNDNDYDNLIEEYIKFIKYFEKLIKEKKYNEVFKIPILIASLERLEYSNVRYLSCGVGRNMYAVDINGDLFPCHRFVGNKEYSLGNIYSGVKNKEKFIDKQYIFNHLQCRNCWVQNLCLGGCPNENLVSTGDMQVSPDRNCKFTKKVYEELIKVYLHLSEEDKKCIFTKNIKKTFA